MNSGQLGRAMRLSITEGALACAMGTLTGGIFLTGFALALGASEFQIGLIAAMPALANVAQVAGSYLIERTGHRKRLCVGALTTSRLLWLLVLMAPLASAAISQRAMVWTLIVLLAATNTLNSIGGVGWLSWIRELVPEQIRIGFLSRRNQLDTALALSLSIFGGMFIDWQATRDPASLAGFAIVFALAMLCGLVGLPLMASIPEARGVSPPDALSPRFSKLLAAPLRDGNFRKVLGFYAYWNLAVNVSAPFFAVFMLQKLHLPFWHVTALCTLSSISGLLANRFWTRLSEKFGHRPIVFLATLGDAIYPLWWLFVTPQTTWLLLPIHCSGLFGAPLAVGPNNMVFKLSPPKNASPYMAIFNAIVGPITAAAAILGGWLAGACGRWEFSIGAMSFGGLHLLFAVSCAGRLTSLALLWRVTEPRSHAIGRVVRILGRRYIRKPSALAPAMYACRGIAAAGSRLILAVTPLGFARDSNVVSLARIAVSTAGSTATPFSTDETPPPFGGASTSDAQPALADPVAA